MNGSTLTTSTKNNPISLTKKSNAEEPPKSTITKPSQGAAPPAQLSRRESVKSITTAAPARVPEKSKGQVVSFL